MVKNTDNRFSSWEKIAYLISKKYSMSESDNEFLTDMTKMAENYQQMSDIESKNHKRNDDWVL